MSYDHKQIIFNCSEQNFTWLKQYVEASERGFEQLHWSGDRELEKLTGKSYEGIRTSMSLALKRVDKRVTLFHWIKERKEAEEEKAARIAEAQHREHRLQKILERKAMPFQDRVTDRRNTKRQRVMMYEKKQREWNDAPSVYFSSFADFDENWNPIYTLKVGKSNNHPNTRTKHWGRLIVSIPYACETNVHTWLEQHLPRITLGHGREGGSELFGSFEDGLQLQAAAKSFAELYAQQYGMKVRYG